MRKNDIITGTNSMIIKEPGAQGENRSWGKKNIVFWA